MEIIRVASVEDWQAACAAKGPRTVVFDRGGYFPLPRESVIANDDFHVLGETAPEPVIFSQFGLCLRANNVTLRHLTVLPGPGPDGQNRDGIRVLPTRAKRPTRGLRIINMSVGWSCDEVFSLANDAVEDALIQDCIFAEALRIAGGATHPEWTHPKGAHAMGMLIGRRNRGVRIVANLFAFNFFRNPALHTDSEALVLDNVIYSPFEDAAHVYVQDGVGPAAAEFAGNWLVDGPTVYGNRVTRPVSYVKPMTKGRVLVHDNHRSQLGEALPPQVRATIAHAGSRPAAADGFSERIRRSAIDRVGAWRDGPDLPWPAAGPKDLRWTPAPGDMEALTAWSRKLDASLGGRSP